MFQDGKALRAPFDHLTIVFLKGGGWGGPRGVGGTPPPQETLSC